MSDRRRDKGVDLDDDEEGFTSAEVPLIPFYWAGEQTPGKRAERQAQRILRSVEAGGDLAASRIGHVRLSRK